MRYICDGMAYDTAKAEALYCWTKPSEHFEEWGERTLYRAADGLYFEVRMSNKFRNPDQAGPLSDAEARNWCELYANGEYERIFGPCEDAKSRPTLEELEDRFGRRPEVGTV